MGANLAKDKEYAENSKVINIEEEEQFESTVASDKLVLIDYYADWCPPCIMFGPTFDKLSAEFEEEVTFGKVISKQITKKY